MMGLIGTALIAANEFVAAFPDAKIISGKRTIASQATAMAKNIVKDRDFLVKTYLHSYARDMCQRWLDRNPKATVDQIAVGLGNVMATLTFTQLSALSKHLGGMAFDVEVIDGPKGEVIKTGLKNIVERHGGKFLDKEGSLIRWHAQF